MISDSSAMYQNWASSEKVTKFLLWQPHASPKISQQVISEWIKLYANLAYYHWAIVLKSTHIPIGSIGVVKLNEADSVAQVAYCLGESWWNKGLMTEALKAVIDYLFNQVKVDRIEAKHDSRNPSSGKVMKKCGMLYEGTLRSSHRNNQGLYDACYYAILRSDYKS